jgi:hypothetical protein
LQAQRKTQNTLLQDWMVAELAVHCASAEKGNTIVIEPSTSASPEHNGRSLKALRTVGPAAVVYECTQRVQPHTNWPQLLITNCVVVACKACQQLRDVLHIRQRLFSLLLLLLLLWLLCIAAATAATQHELPARATNHIKNEHSHCTGVNVYVYFIHLSCSGCGGQKKTNASRSSSAGVQADGAAPCEHCHLCIHDLAGSV